jgi:hypothetical protein
MADDSCVVARRTSESTTVTDFLLDVADDGTFWALAHGKDVTDGKSGLLSAVYE